MEPLDATRVHPESYPEARKLLRGAGVDEVALRALARRGGGLDDDARARLQAGTGGADAP